MCTTKCPIINTHIHTSTHSNKHTCTYIFTLSYTSIVYTHTHFTEKNSNYNNAFLVHMFPSTRNKFKGEKKNMMWKN